MKRIILLFIVFSLGDFSTYSQSVKGRVVNPEDNPLPSVTVRVIGNDTIPVKYFTTNLKGAFKERIPHEKYTLVFSFIGYESLSVKVANENKGTIDLGKIVLQIKDNLLDEVQVNGSGLVEKADRIIAYPSAHQVKHTSNSFELLQVLNLPGLLVDNVQEKVSISGTSGVNYKINNLPATYDQVAALRSNEILRIEYHRTPSVRELASDSGVINFILKENRIGTFASTDFLTAVTTGFINGRLNGKTIGDKSEFSVGYKINYRNYDKTFINTQNRYEFPNSSIDEQVLGGPNRFGYTTQSINLGYTYHDKKNTLDLQFSNEFHQSNSAEKMNVTNNISTTDYRRSTHSDKKSYTPTLNLYYIRTINQDRIFEVGIMGRLAYNDSDSELTDTYGDTIANTIRHNSTETRKVLAGELCYSDSKNKYFSFNLGTRATISYTDNKYNRAKTTFDKYEFYPYVELKGQHNKFHYQLYTALLVNYLSIGKESRTNNINNISGLILYYSTKRWSLRNHTGYNTSSPSLSQLTNNDQRENSLLVWRGNPELDPYQNFFNQTQVTLNFTKNFYWESTMIYRKTFKPIATHYCYDNELASVLSQPFNARYNQNTQTASVFYCNSLFEIISFNLGIIYNDFLTKSRDYRHTFNSFSWFMGISALYKGFGLFAEYQKPKQELTGEFIQTHENHSSVAIRYVKKQFSINLGIRFFLQEGAKYRTRLLNSTYNFDGHSLMKDNANMLFIKLSYSISSGKSPLRVNKKISLEDNETSIKE